jgi:hypothetical protein
MTARPADVDVDARRRRHIALVAALLLNGTFLAILDHLMQPAAMQRPASAQHDAVGALLFRLIDPEPCARGRTDPGAGRCQPAYDGTSTPAQCQPFFSHAGGGRRPDTTLRGWRRHRR